MKRAESSLNAIERVSKFDANSFLVGDPVSFRDPDSGWQMGKLEKVPELMKDKTIKITVNGKEIFLNIPPKLITLESTKPPVKINGKVYQRKAPSVGPNGEIWFDLENILDSSDVLHNIEQSVYNSLKEITNKEIDIGVNIGKMVEKVKRIKGEKRVELMVKINQLDLKTKEMQRQFNALGELSEIEAGQFATASGEIKRLIAATENNERDLDAEIEKILEGEAKNSDVKKKKDDAAGAEAMLARNLAAMDSAEKSLFDTAHSLWEAKKTAREEWEEKRTKLVAAEKNAKQPPEKAAALAALHAHDVAEAEKPGKEPTLKVPSKDKAMLTENLIAFWNHLVSQYNAAPVRGDYKFFALINAVVKKRREVAVKEGKTDFDPAANLTAFTEETAKAMEATLAEWKTMNEAESFNFGVEKDKLVADANRLGQNLTVKPNTALEKKLKGIEQKIHALKKGDANVDETMIDMWRELGELEKDVFSVELKEQMESKEKEVKFIDLPRDLMKEMMKSNEAAFKEAVNQSYEAVIDGKFATAGLQKSLENWLDGVKVDDYLRSRFSQAGIKDWEGFKKQFKDKIVEKFSQQLIANTDSQLRNLLTQKLGDIKNNPAGWNVFSKNFWSELKQEKWDTSTFANMKASVSLRMGINMVVLGTAGVGTSLALKLVPVVPGVVKAGIVGGVVGFAKAGLQRLMGDSSYFAEAQAKAKAEAEEKKKKIIAQELMGKLYDENGVLNQNQEDMMADLFTTAMRRVTGEKEGQKLEVVDGTNKIVLKGDVVCMFHEMLKNAAEDEGIDADDIKVRFEFAKALHAVHNNDVISVQEKDPAEVRAWQAMIGAYTGMSAVRQRGGQSPELSPKHDKTAEEKEAEEKLKTRFVTQALVTSGIGATVGMAIASESMLGRGTLGAATFGLMGEKASLQRERNKADLESIKHIERDIIDLNNAVNLALNYGAKYSGREDAKAVKECHDLFAALLAGRSVDNISFNNIPKEIATYYKTHAKDVAGLLQRNIQSRSVVEGFLREVSRSGLLEKEGFANCMEQMKITGDKLEEEAKNSMGVRFGRATTRHLKSAIYAAVGAGVSIGIGQAIDAVKHHMFGEQPVAQAAAARPRVGSQHENAAAATAGAAKVAAEIPRVPAPVEQVPAAEPAAPEAEPAASAPEVVPARVPGLVEAPHDVKNFNDFNKQIFKSLGYTKVGNDIHHSLVFHGGAKMTVVDASGEPMLDKHGKTIEYTFEDSKKHHGSYWEAMNKMKGGISELIKDGKAPTIKISGDVSVGDKNGNMLIEHRGGGAQPKISFDKVISSDKLPPDAQVRIEKVSIGSNIRAHVPEGWKIPTMADGTVMIQHFSDGKQIVPLSENADHDTAHAHGHVVKYLDIKTGKVFSDEGHVASIKNFGASKELDWVGERAKGVDDLPKGNFDHSTVAAGKSGVFTGADGIQYQQLPGGASGDYYLKDNHLYTFEGEYIGEQNVGAALPAQTTWSSGGPVADKAGLESMLKGTRAGGPAEAGTPQMGGVKAEVLDAKVAEPAEEPVAEVPAERVPAKFVGHEAQYRVLQDMKNDIGGSIKEGALATDVSHDGSKVLPKLMDKLEAALAKSPKLMDSEAVQKALSSTGADGNKLADTRMLALATALDGSHNIKLSAEERMLLGEDFTKGDDFLRIPGVLHGGKTVDAWVAKDGSHAIVYEDPKTHEREFVTDVKAKFDENHVTWPPRKIATVK